MSISIGLKSHQPCSFGSGSPKAAVKLVLIGWTRFFYFWSLGSLPKLMAYQQKSVLLQVIGPHLLAGYDPGPLSAARNLSRFHAIQLFSRLAGSFLLFSVTQEALQKSPSPAVMGFHLIKLGSHRIICLSVNSKSTDLGS